MPEKTLNETTFYYNWNSLEGALHGVLNFYGETYTTSQVMGLSTLAFRIQMDKIATHYCPTTFDFDTWLNWIGPIFGLKFDTIMVTNETPDYDTKKNTAIDKITKWIDSNNPVMYFEPQSYEWYLITGYNTENKEFIITGMDGEYYMPYDELGKDETNTFLWCIYPEKTTKLEAPEKFYKALNHAVYHFYTETPNDYLKNEGYTYGNKAWELWLNIIPTGTVSESGLSYNVRALRSARESAWLFLTFLYENMQEFKTTEMENAITYYKNTVEYLTRVEDLYPFTHWTETTLQSDDYRIKNTLDWLKKAWEWEQKAVENIKTFLEQKNYYHTTTA